MLKQLKSTKSIQAIAPEDKRLREKYKDNPQKLSSGYSLGSLKSIGEFFSFSNIKGLFKFIFVFQFPARFIQLQTIINGLQEQIAATIECLLIII
mgnify:CR=1 FL=1